MRDDETFKLFELADLVSAVSRQLFASKEYRAYTSETWAPLEIAAMRYIDAHPGTSASAAAAATQQVASNFSRALRGLEQKGMVRREVDETDARRTRLYPTEAADENLRRLRDIWSHLLEGIITDEDELDRTLATLRRIESGLARPT